MSGFYGGERLALMDAEQGGPRPPSWPPTTPINGHYGLSGGVIATPVVTVTVKLDGDYDGQMAVMRANPRRSVIKGLASGEPERFFPAIADLVVSWNFGDEDGNPVAPTAENIEDLPDGQMAMLVNKYYEAIKERAAVPLPSSEESATSSMTSASPPSTVAE